MNANSAHERRTTTQADQTGPTTRDRILDTALDLIARQGVGETSMRELAREAAVSVQTLYYHFSSKDDIVSALRQRTMGEYLDAEASLDSLPSPLEERIIAFARLNLEAAAQTADATRFQLRECMDLQPDALDLGARYADAMEQRWIDVLASATDVDPRADLRKAARTIRMTEFGAVVVSLTQPPGWPALDVMRDC